MVSSLCNVQSHIINENAENRSRTVVKIVCITFFAKELGGINTTKDIVFFSAFSSRVQTHESMQRS